MDYVATEFLPLADLPAGTADLVRAHVGSDAAWEQLVTQHDDRAAALLAVCGALSRTVLTLKDGGAIGGLEMVSEIKQLAGDRPRGCRRAFKCAADSGARRHCLPRGISHPLGSRRQFRLK